MGKLNDLTGQRFGKLVAKEYIRQEGKRSKWRCVCDCGNETFVLANSLLKGRTKSCGCYNIQYHNEHYKDLKGKKFGLWTALYKTSDKNGCSAWYCKCECGTERIVTTSRLTSGNSKSCGCAIKRHSTHNMSHTRIYRIYRSMLDRCNNPKSQSYRLYGGRGIKVCDEWMDVSGFEHFYEWSLKNGYDDSLTIDRENNNGNYEPLNCRWVSYLVQENNTSKNHFVTYENETHTIAEWSRIKGINVSTLRNRVLKGWDNDRLFIPPQNSKGG